MPRKGDAPKRHAVLDALQSIGPMTRRELEQFVGASECGIRKITSSLHAEGLVHIGGWDVGRDGIRRKPAAIYAFGPGRDVQFRRMQPAEVSRRYRAKRAGIVAARRAANQGVFGQMVEQLRRAV